jgi:integrase
MAVADPAGRTLFSKGPINAASMSASINKLIRAAGVPVSPRLTCYSFRHAHMVALERTGKLKKHQVEYAMGHSQNTIQAGYRMPLEELEILRDAFVKANQIKGDVSPLNYTDDELPEAHR